MVNDRAPVLRLLLSWQRAPAHEAAGSNQSLKEAPGCLLRDMPAMSVTAGALGRGEIDSLQMYLLTMLTNPQTGADVLIVKLSEIS